MDTQKVASEYRLSQWTQRLQAQKNSGQSITEFCEAMGVSRNTYFYWQKKVREAACERLVEYHTEANSTRLAPSGFAEIMIEGTTKREQSPEMASPGQLRIEAAGARIMADSEYPAEKLAALVRELLRPC